LAEKNAPAAFYGGEEMETTGARNIPTHWESCTASRPVAAAIG
jgi:hypothetical protein